MSETNTFDLHEELLGAEVETLAKVNSDNLENFEGSLANIRLDGAVDKALSHHLPLVLQPDSQRDMIVDDEVLRGTSEAVLGRLKNDWKAEPEPHLASSGRLGMVSVWSFERKNAGKLYIIEERHEKDDLVPVFAEVTDIRPEDKPADNPRSIRLGGRLLAAVQRTRSRSGK